MNSKVIFGILAALALGGVSGIFVGMGLAEKERTESADAALLTAHQAFQNGNYVAALESAFAATDRRPGTYAGYEIIGDFFVKGNDGTHARTFYQRALESLGARGSDSNTTTIDTPAHLEFEKNRIDAKLKALDASNGSAR